MAAFDYRALDTGGKQARGLIEADSARAARALLRERQLTPLSVTETRIRARGKTSLFQRNLSVADIALGTRQLATLLNAGIPLEQALNAVANQSEKQATQRVFHALRSKVREGYSLAVSLADYPNTFPSLYRSTVEAGERTGHLDKVLEKLADYLEAQQAFRQQIQLALIYPALLVTLSFLIVTGLMVFVVPEILAVVTEAGQTLPLPTQILVAISALITHHGLWLLLLALALIAAGIALGRQARMQHAWHQLLLHWWGLKRLTRGTNSARYTSTLAILVQSGIPLNDAMSIASAVCSNTVFKRSTIDAQLRVQEGQSLYRALEHTGYFPPMLLQLIASGEQSGNLGEMLQRGATTLEHDLQQRVKTLVSLFEPLTLLFMGALVLGIVLAVLLPILNLNQLIA